MKVVMIIIQFTIESKMFSMCFGQNEKISFMKVVMIFMLYSFYFSHSVEKCCPTEIQKSNSTSSIKVP
jgi:hypothetical protein